VGGKKGLSAVRRNKDRFEIIVRKIVLLYVFDMFPAHEKLHLSGMPCAPYTDIGDQGLVDGQGCGNVFVTSEVEQSAPDPFKAHGISS
jgi:hypothetical protein